MDAKIQSGEVEFVAAERGILRKTYLASASVKRSYGRYSRLDCGGWVKDRLH